MLLKKLFKKQQFLTPDDDHLKKNMISSGTKKMSPVQFYALIFFFLI